MTYDGQPSEVGGAGQCYVLLSVAIAMAPYAAFANQECGPEERAGQVVRKGALPLQTMHSFRSDSEGLDSVPFVGPSVTANRRVASFAPKLPFD
jgi:hypothetical protein